MRNTEVNKSQLLLKSPFVIKYYIMKKINSLTLFLFSISALTTIAYGAQSLSGVTYNLKNAADGYAAGAIDIKLKGDIGTNSEVVVYWGKAGKPISGYSFLAKNKVTNDTVTINIASGIIIPSEARQILTHIRAIGEHSLPSSPHILNLPENAAAKPVGTPTAEFQVVSDIHLTTDKNKKYTNNSKHFTNMLEQITKISGKKSLGLIINGDITQKGLPAEYKLLHTLKQKVPNAPRIYLSIGNHDLWGVWKKKMNMEQSDRLFLSNTALPDGTTPADTCYDFWLNGHHFIILGTDTFSTLNATFTDSTLEWLDEKLAENHNPTRPAFVFVHQTIKDTVGGSLTRQTNIDKLNRDGVINWKELKAILGKYDSTLVFTSHSHWSMYSGTSYFTEEGQPNYFNTASVSYIVDDYNKVTGERNLNASQGYFIYIYEDQIQVRGFDFIEKLWISGAQFSIKTK